MITGDLILCSGNGRLSKAIKTAQRIMPRGRMLGREACEISHVAMYVEGQVFEATTLNKWCGKKGVQMNPYEDWITHYDGRVWLVPLIGLPFGESFAGLQRELNDDACMYMHAKRLCGMAYESGIPGALELLLAGIEWRWFRSLFKLDNRLGTKTTLHCTEAVTLVLKAANMLGMVNEHKMPPMEWWDELGKFRQNLCKGYEYGQPILVKG